jgi:hypothetical protein
MRPLIKIFDATSCALHFPVGQRLKDASVANNGSDTDGSTHRNSLLEMWTYPSLCLYQQRITPRRKRKE